MGHPPPEKHGACRRGHIFTRSVLVLSAGAGGRCLGEATGEGGESCGDDHHETPDPATGDDLFTRHGMAKPTSRRQHKQRCILYSGVWNNISHSLQTEQLLLRAPRAVRQPQLLFPKTRGVHSKDTPTAEEPFPATNTLALPSRRAVGCGRGGWVGAGTRNIF